MKLPAPQYIDYVLTWVEGLIKDESVFPTKAGTSQSLPACARLVQVLMFRSTGREFSPNFPSVARHIYTQLLRIFAHLYHAHYPIFLHLSSEGHLNSLFAHFLTFGREFDLLEEKETRAPKEGWPFVVGDLMDVSKMSSRGRGTVFRRADALLHLVHRRGRDSAFSSHKKRRAAIARSFLLTLSVSPSVPARHLSAELIPLSHFRSSPRSLIRSHAIAIIFPLVIRILSYLSPLGLVLDACNVRFLSALKKLASARSSHG